MPKKIPMRTCLGCETVRPKREMLRIVRTPDGQVEIDPTGKKAGRGAYLCPKADCIRQAIRKKKLSKVFDAEISPSIIEELERFAAEEIDKV